ncbi:MAG TPA: hypothetical protein VJT78_12610 [Candidatus Dormibacteraeota bacterium]|nr:hypothetical protein [Candidatus Dormibacteraeota bacterium]
MLFLPGTPSSSGKVAACTAQTCPAGGPTAKQSPSGSANRPPAPATTLPHAPANPAPAKPAPPAPRSTPKPAPPPVKKAPPPPVPPTRTGACPAPAAFPVAAFAPSFVGPITRTFQQQYITNYGSYVETCYPAGSSAPSSGSAGGAQAHLPLAGGARDDATLTYDIRFPSGFTWVKGGKLPGLCGGLCWTGSNNGPGGWAARFMWRAGGAGEVLLSDATTTGYGTDLGLGSWHFQADGQWHVLTEHVHLNTPGAANGYIDVTYNGVAVAHFAGITFRTASTTRIDSLIFSTFFGGHDSTWAPTTAMRIDFANFRAA